MAVKQYTISCAGCSERFVFRSLTRLAKRIGLHRCWEQPQPLKRHADTFGEPDPDWRPTHG